MDQLSHMKCSATRAGEPTVSEAELAQYMPQVSDWHIVKVDGIDHLERTFTFPNFVDALSFTNRIGDLAEAQGHHPALLTEWGKVTVAWWTHSIGGLHRNDFIMAAKTDPLYGRRSL